MPIICTAFTITIIPSVTEVIEFVITEFSNIYSVREKNISSQSEKRTELRETLFFRQSELSQGKEALDNRGLRTPYVQKSLCFPGSQGHKRIKKIIIN